MNTYNTLVERRKANEHKQRALTFFQLYQKLTKGASPWGHSAQQPANFWDFHFFTSPFVSVAANQPTTHRKITNICESRFTYQHGHTHRRTRRRSGLLSNMSREFSTDRKKHYANFMLWQGNPPRLSRETSSLQYDPQKSMCALPNTHV